MRQFSNQHFLLSEESKISPTVNISFEDITLIAVVILDIGRLRWGGHVNLECERGIPHSDAMNYTDLRPYLISDCAITICNSKSLVIEVTQHRIVFRRLASQSSHDGIRRQGGQCRALKGYKISEWIKEGEIRTESHRNSVQIVSIPHRVERVSFPAPLYWHDWYLNEINMMHVSGTLPGCCHYSNCPFRYSTNNSFIRVLSVG